MSKFITIEKLGSFLNRVKEYIPTKTSELTNDSNFTTTQYVDAAISTIPDSSNITIKRWEAND